jgi:hypothetical protein
MSDPDAGEEASRDDPIRDKLEALLPPEAFEPIARALGGRNVKRSSLEALQGWLREDFYSFYLSCTADRSTRAKWERERTKRHRAAATLLSSLQSGSVLDWPRVLLDEAFHEKFMRALETLARPPQRRRHRPNDAFRYDLAPGLIWVYEHITRKKAQPPYWLRHSRAYGGKFYLFACAVRNCLYDRVPEVRAGLPATEGALAQELQDHWPEAT